MNEREQAQQHAARLEAIADQISGANVRRELRYAATFLRALADRPERRQIRHVNGLYPPRTSIRLQVLGCTGTSEYTDIDVELPCAPQEPAQPVAQELPYGFLITSVGGAERFTRRCPVALTNEELSLQPLYASPPSHPAPSEAGAERQERDRE